MKIVGTKGKAIYNYLEVGRCKMVKKQLHQDSFFHETFERSHRGKCSSSVLKDFLENRWVVRAVCSVADLLRAEVAWCL